MFLSLRTHTQHDTLSLHDALPISLPKPPPVEPQPEKMDLDIVYEDDHLIVDKKEAGMVVHPAYANWSGTLVNGLMHYTQQNLSKKDEESLRPGIVHRIDRANSELQSRGHLVCRLL